MPQDERDYSPAALETLRTASRHVGYLINEDCDLKPATAFAGNRFMRSERRPAIMRCLAAKERLAERSRKAGSAACGKEKKL